MIAALYVQRGGAYYGLEDVEPWALPDRDAREYRGPWPVVAHPPCSRWCRLAGLIEARWGLVRGDDGGCFEHALATVRKFGGVLEHPAYSDAWPAFGLPRPRPGGWQLDVFGGASCHVEQCRYGHRAKKATWLYAVGCDLPSLDWRVSVDDRECEALVSWCGNHTQAHDTRPRLTRREASATPPAFRQMLIKMARSAMNNRKAGASGEHGNQTTQAEAVPCS